MATIIEFGTMFTLTEDAAKHMEKAGLIKECGAEHTGVLEVDLPIYHRAYDAPQPFGFTTIPSYIKDAEKVVSNA